MHATRVWETWIAKDQPKTEENNGTARENLDMKREEKRRLWVMVVFKGKV